MKKKIIALAAVIAIAASFAGCKNDESKSQVVGDGVSSTAATQSAEQGDAVQASTAPEKSAEQVQEELDNFAKDADENVDMSKIEGTDISGSATEGFEDSGTLGNYEVKINSAKLADSDSGKVAVVEFEFKNNSSNEVNFAGVIKTLAMQDESDLPPAMTYSAEGFDSNTVAQTISNGDSIKVQKAYVVSDENQPIVVQASLFDSSLGGGMISKTFNLK